MVGIFKSISQIDSVIKAIYFANGAADVCLWIRLFGCIHIPKHWFQELREYDDTDLSGESLCIHLISNTECIVRAAYDGHLSVWRVRICS